MRKTHCFHKNNKAPFAIYEAPFRYPTNEDLLVATTLTVIQITTGRHPDPELLSYMPTQSVDTTPSAVGR